LGYSSLVGVVHPWLWASHKFEGDGGGIVEIWVAIHGRGGAASDPDEYFNRLLGREDRLEVARAVGGQQLLEAADRPITHHDLRERHAPGLGDERVARLGIASHVDLLV